MRLDKFDRQLRLMILLTQNREYTLDEICDRLEISRRNLYYYIEGFKENGFIVEKKGQVYRLDKDSPFFKNITELVHFTEDEAVILRQVLSSASNTSVQIRNLKNKLDKLYDFDILSNVDVNKQTAKNIGSIYDAIKEHRQVKICNYSSPHSDTTSDRIVEPFLFLNGNEDVRCYELKSGMNKSFKVSRMGDVQLLDLLWSNQSKHKQVYTDLFQFSGEERRPVKLRLGRLSYNILKEEYPKSEKYISQESDEYWIFSTDVCSYKGVGRFVLGLFEDIKVVESAEFREYLKEKIARMTL
ncbi:MAG: WYL domain-containing protein [Bacteroidaceae bacterium]|nr:WYL domain-containing protein [Bacteroidaceae bacterium]